MNVEFVPVTDENNVLLSIDLPSPPGRGDTITLSVENEKDYHHHDEDFAIVGVHWVPTYISASGMNKHVGKSMGVICTVKSLGE